MLVTGDRDSESTVIMKKARIYKYLIPWILLPAMTACGAANSSPGTSPVTRNADWRPVEQDFDGVIMVLVPVGCFIMGSTEEQVEHARSLGAGDWAGTEQPAHEICFDVPFWIDKYEVYQAQFQRLGGIQANAPYFSGSGRPVEHITWFEARDFCELRAARLPTEAEWEYAARGPDALIYPWGNEWNASNVGWDDGNLSETLNVGSIPGGASWVGALDMSGNVLEWTSSLFEPYPYDVADGRERDTGSSTADVFRVLRGGSLAYSRIVHLRAAFRFRNNPGGWFGDGGFRCARPVATES